MSSGGNKRNVTHNISTPGGSRSAGAVGDLGEGFRTRFEIIRAVTDAQKDAVYRVRHNVYCEDLSLEPISQDGWERDEYDAHAKALLLRHIGIGEYVACVRLIRPGAGCLEDPLPFEQICAGTLDHALIGSDPIPRTQIAEASRLAIISKFRRRTGEAPVPSPLSEQDFGDEHFPRFPYIVVGLYLGVIALAKFEGVERLFVLTEPRLAEHLSRLDVHVTSVGGPVEHHGIRYPSMIAVDSVIKGLNRYVRPIYDEIVRQLELSPQ